MRQTNKKNALANIWHIEIADPMDGLAYLHASLRFNTNKRKDTEILHDSLACTMKRRNAMSNIWHLNNYYSTE